MFSKFWTWLKSLFGGSSTTVAAPVAATVHPSPIPGPPPTTVAPLPTPAPTPPPAVAPQPVIPPAPSPVVQPPLTVDADGYVSVAQLPGLTQPVVIANQRVCTVLVKAQLDPKSAQYFGVTKNCAATSLAIASSISVPGSFSNHNTAYGVVGTYPNFSLNGQPNGLNICTPDTITTNVADLVAYLNALPVYTEQFPQPAASGATGQGEVARRAEQQAAKAK